MPNNAIARTAREKNMMTFPNAGSSRTLRATRPPLEKRLSTPPRARVEVGAERKPASARRRRIAPESEPPMINALVAALLLPAVPAPLAGDWGNAGGNAARNGATFELGPLETTVLWSGGKPSIIAWQPVTEGGRLFLVRQTSFVPSGVPNDAPIIGQDLETGAELWTVNLPFSPGDWTTWVAGVRNGRVFASRAGNGASSKAPLFALDAATGAILWTSVDEIDAGAYDGVTFAPTATRWWRASPTSGASTPPRALRSGTRTAPARSAATAGVRCTATRSTSPTRWWAGTR
jgi:hypothetical protein